jgi:uncharacterized protein YjiS (DUF1127 family)
MKVANMTYATDTLTRRSPWIEMKSDLIARWTRYSLYRTTLAELSALSTRDLADIGLNRSQIRAKAYEIAYGPAA